MSNLSSKLFKFTDKLINFAQNFEKIPNNYPEAAVLILYPLLVAFFGYFHEPWFDEAQAWQIAKIASYRDILFYTPHFEGHPPFWHLLLSVFAKNHFPYEITIKSISFVFSYMGIILILFKSPFYRIIRVLLPFSYFLFYQYTIISRPYCLVMPAFAILAIYFYKKQEKPFCYALGLIFLASTHPYSFILSGMLAFLWFIECIREKVFKSKKIIGAFILLGIFYFSMIYILIPSPEAYAINISSTCNFLKRIIYTVFMLPSDCFYSFFCNTLTSENYSLTEILLGSSMGAIIWYFIYLFTKQKKLFIVFFVPYIIFAILATKYFSLQHIGIIFCFIIFICWITLNYPETYDDKIPNIAKKCLILLICIALYTNLYWNFKSCILDIFITYTIGRNEAKFIKENNLDKYKIFCEFEDNSAEEDYSKINPNLNGIWLAIAPYFEKNIFYNFNNGLTEKNYVLHRKPSEEEIKELFKKWEDGGFPDIIAGNNIRFWKIFKQKPLNTKNYTVIYLNNTTYIQKGVPLGNHIALIMAKKEIANKLDLKEVEQSYRNPKVDLARITSYIVAKFLIWMDEKPEKAK